jgi:hypothetical protein
MAGGEGGGRLPEPLKIIGRLAIDALKSVLALFKKLSELIASAVGVNESVKAVQAIFYGLIIAMLLAFILTLRSCVGDTDEVASTSSTAQIATTTEASTTTTSTTTTPVPAPTTTTTSVALAPVSQGDQAEKPTTTAKEPTRKISPKTTMAPMTSTTIAPTTTATPETTTTTLPPTTTMVPPRLVTFTFVNDDISQTQWSDTQKTSSITDFVSVSATESTWVKSLPNGTTQFKFRMYRYRNPLGYYPTRISDVVGATCTDDLIQDNSVGRVRPAFAPDTNSYVTVTCDATGTGPITVPLVYSHPTV